MSLAERTDPRFKHLLGKTVQCRDGKGELHVGQLEFAGVNDLLHGKFQVTLSRCPIWPVDPNSVVEYKNALTP